MQKEARNREVDALIEITRWYDADPRIYIEQNLKIKTKEALLVPFVFNTPQELAYERIQRIKAQGKPIRIIFLKARQEGMSTLSEGLIFERTARYENTNSLIVADDPESTSAIFEMSRLFYDELPADFKPLRRYDTKKSMVFENPDEKTRAVEPGLRSHITISTANKTRLGRGLTLHCFHGSEVAYWDNASKLMLAVMQAVPDLTNTVVILESTANGIGGQGKYFYDMVQGALAGTNGFELIFLPWFILPEYSKTFETEAEKKQVESSLDDYEKSLFPEMAKYGVTGRTTVLEKLKWRRWAIMHKCGGDVEQFKQEYPATVQEAFIASSRLVIPKALIEEQAKYIRKPLPREAFQGDRVALDLIDAGVEIYEKPVPRHFYSLGADSAEGEGGDDGALTVLDRMTGREVASFADNRTPPEDLGLLSIKLAIYFNNAFIVPEINHPGPAMLAVLKNSDYPNIYRREVIDQMTHKKTRKIGWRTGATTKPMMVQDFKYALREEELGLSCEATVNQMLSFVKTDETGMYGMGAEEGSKDDRLISAMLAWQGFSELPAP